MLATSSYPAGYVDACRARIDAQLAAYDALVASVGEPARGAFEAELFANLTLVLEASFVHRTRAVEGKDGNALNEVRMLAMSLLRDGGVLAADKTIRYDPARSVLGIAIGDEIRIDEAGFRRLADAFFAELRARFAPS